MATSICTVELTLIDAETNKTYNVVVNEADTERAKNDTMFATTLLENAKQCQQIYNVPDDNNKENKKSSQEQHNWTKQEIMLLLDIYTSKEKDFHSGKNTVKHCWESVANEMQKMGHDISGQKCCIKFQAMKRTYKSIKDHNKKSGNNTKKWEYFELMDKIFSEKPWVEPLAVAGTSCNTDSENSSTEEIREQLTAARKRKLNIDNI
ncbi:uncharacterized protein LOC114934473 [Nylanderia fulva]|uniref:uncharacterized protein LOC114934473 n=1 Tax=Nylanderia fulva TaxID=613905 RepID=UPI0010FBBC25|nr:uncharacterized protein LOC114934473 [Nylanderia fulva]